MGQPRKPHGCTINYATTSPSTSPPHSRPCGCSYGRACDCGANPSSLRFRSKAPCNHCRNCLRNRSSKRSRKRKLRCLQMLATVKSSSNIFSLALPLHPAEQGSSSVKVQLHPGEIHPKALAVLVDSSGPLLDQLPSSNPSLASLPHINFVLLHLHRVACVKRVRQLKALNVQDLKACEETKLELKQLQSTAKAAPAVREIYVDTRVIHDTWQRVKLAEACAMAETKLAHVEGVMAKRSREIRALEARIEERAALRLQVVFRNLQMAKEDVNVASNGSLVSDAVERGEKALIMQRTFRCYRARTTVKALKEKKRTEEENDAVREIQRMRRGQVGRRRAKKRATDRENERRDTAAKILQRYWRELSTREKERELELEKVAAEWAGRIALAATTIQRFTRGWLSRTRRLDRRRQLLLGSRVKHLCQRFISKGDLSGFIHAVNADYEQHQSQMQQMKAQEIDNAQTFITSVLERRQTEVQQTWRRWIQARPENPSNGNALNRPRMKRRHIRHDRKPPWHEDLMSKQLELATKHDQPRLFDPYIKRKQSALRGVKRAIAGPNRLKSISQRPSHHKVFALEDPQPFALPRPYSSKIRPAALLPGISNVTANEPPFRTPVSRLEELAFAGIETFSVLEADATLREPFEALFRNAYMRKAMEDLGAKTVLAMVETWLALTPSNQDDVRSQLEKELDATSKVLHEQDVSTCADVADLTEEDLGNLGVPPSVCSYVRMVLQAAKQRSAAALTSEDMQKTWQKMMEEEKTTTEGPNSVVEESHIIADTLEVLVKRQQAFEKDIAALTSMHAEMDHVETKPVKRWVGLSDEIEAFVIEVVFDRLEQYHDLLPIEDFLALIAPFPKSLQRKALQQRLKVASTTANPYINSLKDAGFHHVHTLAASSLTTVRLPSLARRDILEAFAEMNGLDIPRNAELPPLNAKEYAKPIANCTGEKPQAVAGSRKTQLARRMHHQAFESGKRFEFTSTSVDGVDTDKLDYVHWRNMNKLGVDIDVITPEELGKLEQWGMI